MAASSSVIGPSNQGSRRGSIESVMGKDQTDKENMSQVLDQIHNSASHSDTLTTFNAFSSPPSTSNGTEAKGLAEELIQHGFSGLYNKFKEVVVGNKDRQSSSSVKDDAESFETSSVKSQRSQTANTTASKSSLGLTRESSTLTASPVFVSTASSRIQSPTNASFVLLNPEPPFQQPQRSSTRSSMASTPAPGTNASTRPANPVMVKATASSTAVPTVATVHASAFREDGLPGNTSQHGDASLAKAAFSSQFRNVENKLKLRVRDLDTEDTGSSDFDVEPTISARSSNFGHKDKREERASLASVDGSVDPQPHTSLRSTTSTVSSIKPEAKKHAITQDHLAVSDITKRPAALDRITQSHLPGYQPSRASSVGSIVESSPVTTSAHNSVRHDSFVAHEARANSAVRPTPIHIPGTTTNEGNPEAVNAALEQMRKQVLSKEFWMADDNCRECFLCGDAFTAFRRKHHCRTCGCIFDSKCTAIIPGERFGVQGSLRVCKTCLDIMNRRYDTSDSDDSEDDDALTSSLFMSYKASEADKQNLKKDNRVKTPENLETESRPLATPMMAIPATRRIGDNPNRRSAILEIDAPQLSRPSSARSLKSLTGSRPLSAGHKRHHSKHNFLNRLKSTVEDRAPFHRPAQDQVAKRQRLPTFHDDNIIDPDLAPYMSDEESSGDEQMSIFSALNNDSVPGTSIDNDRAGFSSLLTAGKKHRPRVTGEKSISGMSFTNRGRDDASASGSGIGYLGRNRRRNLSTTSNTIFHPRPSPRQNKQVNLLKGLPSLQNDAASLAEQVPEALSPVARTTRMTRSISMKDAKAPAVELDSASLLHVKRLLRQLLQDADIANSAAWEKALIPILLQCTDDVNPDVRRGDDIDIRHYVKVKKIPGGRPGDTSYVSGVVFTKNLALKSMPRSISHPRIVIVSFPIEYQRQQQFMSLQPVIAQEKDFLRNMVNRIASLQPQLLLVEKHISGLALQYLAEANIAVACNVKPSVIEAVSRCAQTEIISSIDMVALKHVHVGKSEGFDVKTYVHKDIPGRKKTYLYISGCPKELGCTIALRGASMETLTKMKKITEFMVYVVYNLKLETCLMRDELVLIPTVPDHDGNLSSDVKTAYEPPLVPSEVVAGSQKLDAVTDASKKLQEVQDAPVDAGTTSSNSPETTATDNLLHASSTQTAEEPNSPSSGPSIKKPNLVSAHKSHLHEYPVPEDVPMPKYYSDMVAKHQTKILSASPFVKFSPPYLLMRSREQERRLEYLRRLRDQDAFEDQSETEKSKPQKFQLIKPEMVHGTIKGAPRQIMEVLHAVHDAEYDKALHNYQTQTRQWENYIQGNLNLFDPYEHQNIVVLYTLVCTATTVPCSGPDLVALGFYDEHEGTRSFDPDCTLGQYVEDLCLGTHTVCDSNGCERAMFDHHRTYVHGEARITVFVENYPCKIKGLQDSILMWSYCKKCDKETQVMPMSESTWKYSFGKYLELSFWSTELHLRDGFCQHDIHRDHLRYFGFRNVAIRIHYDPIDLLEIVVPRTRITWKVEHDLRLKNELFTKTEERWTRFMMSVKSRIESINVDSVVSEKIDACKLEKEKLAKRAQDEHAALIRKLQDKYMNSKYYEIIPLNRAVRAMQEKVVEWDAAFADFDRNFFPSEKDIRRLAAIQLKKIFMDDESTVSLTSQETAETHEIDEKSPGESIELPAENISSDDLPSVPEQELAPSADDHGIPLTPQTSSEITPADLNLENIQPLDLAVQTPTAESETSDITPKAEDTQSPLFPLVQPIQIERPATPARTSSVPVEDDLQTPKATVSSNFLETSGIPRPERGATRRRGSNISPPLNRAQSQPAGTLRRVQASKIFSRDSNKSITRELAPFSAEVHRTPTNESNKSVDKKLSERLGLKTLNRKTGHSLIPRSVQGKRKDSKVSSLAKHFEQLSREFEKERMRDRKQRAAKATQSRAFPKASSKPIVEVYKDVNEAVAERVQADDDTKTPSASTTSVDNYTNEARHNRKGKDQEVVADGETTDATATAEETATEAETDDNMPTTSQAGSDDEGAASDVDGLLDIRIPDAAELAESLGVGGPTSDSQLDLPRHEKTSLMKVLSNFWAERSASGWTALDYPLNFQDHVFADSDVIVREDEPSSLIAFALNSMDYRSQIDSIRRAPPSPAAEERVSDHPHLVIKRGPHDYCEDNIDSAGLETTLLQGTGTHMKFQFVEGSARMLCKIFYVEQFDALRQKCGVQDRIVESLSRCLKWDSKGGKTKSVFLKTLDDRLILKSLSPIETRAFLLFAPAYFNIMAEILFHDLPSAIAKMLGFYQVIIKNPATNTDIKLDLLLMENLFYDRSPARIFDLKGSMRNRKIQSTGEQNEVLLDENMVEFIYESPLFAREHSKKLLRASVWNDTLFLARQDVMDYSLMIAVDEHRKELVVGIIDCIRTYTWDKKLESWIKDRGFAGGGRNRPTVTSPKEYKSRFREAMARYVLQAPNCWHQFQQSLIAAPPVDRSNVAKVLTGPVRTEANTTNE